MNAIRLLSRCSQRSVVAYLSGTCRPGNCRSDPTLAASYWSWRHSRDREEFIMATHRSYSQAGNGAESEKRILKIYTRTGDKGTSVTIAGDRRPKDDIVFEAVGATDELSSNIGLAREFVQEANLESCDEQLKQIQCVLQDAGSNIATPRSLASSNQLKMTEFDGDTVEMLEDWIDEMTRSLPPLRNFILPSGGKASCALHVARSVCRRAERSIAPLTRDEEIDPAVSRFINRLSDYLFTAARFAAKEEGREETIYRRVKPKDRK